MARPTKGILCRRCKRWVDVIIIKYYGIVNKKDPDETLHFQKLLIKDHRKSFWKSRHCSSSGKRITNFIGRSNIQAG